MGQIGQLKTQVHKQYEMGKSTNSKFNEEVRLNVNDLLKKRKEENKIDKRINVLILSGATAFTVVILAFLSL